MSAIIGVVREGKVIMATDTQRTWGNVQTRAGAGYGSNVIWTENGVMLGVAGYQLIKYAIVPHPEWFDGLAHEPLTKRYLVERVIPPFYRAMEEIEGIEEKSAEQGRSRFSGAVLVARDDRLLCIDGDFGVIDVPDWCMIGSGSEYAAPRMERFWRKDLSERETVALLRDALTDAATYSKRTSPPFVIGDTVTKKLTGLEDEK